MAEERDELLDEMAELDRVEASIDSAESAVKTAGQIESMAREKPLIDAIMVAHDAARASNEAAEISLKSSEIAKQAGDRDDEQALEIEKGLMRKLNMISSENASLKKRASRNEVFSVLNMMVILSLTAGLIWAFLAGPLASGYNSVQSAQNEPVMEDLKIAQMQISERVLSMEESLLDLQSSMKETLTQMQSAAEHSSTAVNSLTLPEGFEQLPAKMADLSVSLQKVRQDMTRIQRAQKNTRQDAAMYKRMQKLEEMSQTLVAQQAALQASLDKAMNKANENEKELERQYRFVAPGYRAP